VALEDSTLGGFGFQGSKSDPRVFFNNVMDENFCHEVIYTSYVQYNNLHLYGKTTVYHFSNFAYVLE